MDNKIVSVEIAKKLKQIGFDLKTFYWYGCDEPLSGIAKSNQLMERIWLHANELNDEDVQSGTMIYNAPYLFQVHAWLREKGYSIDIHPEYYIDGINWNVQVTWYLPKNERTKFNVMDGTMWYGDIGEYPTYDDALEFGIDLAINKIINNKSENNE
jgi:hypothetical protein